MKYHTAQILALASVVTAYPRPQLPGLGGLGLTNKLPLVGGGSGLPLPGVGSGSSGGSGLPLLGGGGLPGLGGAGSSGGSGSSSSSGPSSGGSGLPLLGGGGSSGGSGLPLLGGGGSGLPLPGMGSGSSGGSGLPLLGGGGGSGLPLPGVGSLLGARSRLAEPVEGAGGDSTGSSGTTVGNCKPQAASSSLLGGTENGIVDKNCCTDMTIIFARGTGEMGNVGTVSGPPMFKAIRSKLGDNRVTVQGVDYPASAAGNANLGGDGGEKMAALVKQAKTQCPKTKIIVSGYSQGAMVVHSAFRNGLSASDVSGAVMFGDPLKRTAVGNLPAAQVKQFCGTADQICGGGGDGGAAGSHLSYGSSADAAATFAIQAAGLA